MFDNLLPQLVHLRGESSSSTLYIDDYHVHVASWTEFLSVCIIFHILMLLFLTSYVRAMFTPAGTIPNTPYWREGQFQMSDDSDRRLRELIRNIDHGPLTQDELTFLRSLPVAERKQKKLGLRYCRKCQSFKPDRCHHCEPCGECVLRMDHHCAWIGNCIGFFNYKFFLQVLFYGICCTLFILAAMLPRLALVFQPILSTSFFFLHDFEVVIVYVACVFICAGLVIFFSFHIHLTLSALTTIEHKEKFNHSDPGFRWRFMVGHGKVDYGSYGNFKAVFGPWYMWLLPVMPLDHDGINGTYPPICTGASSSTLVPNHRDDGRATSSLLSPAPASR